MTRIQIERMILALIAAVDYDLAKSFDPKTAEEPEYIEEQMDRLVAVVKKHLEASYQDAPEECSKKSAKRSKK